MKSFDDKINYSLFYNTHFLNGKYCTKSWGYASYKAGQQSKQAEVDELRKRINSVEKLISTWDSELDELRRCGDRSAHCLSVCIVELIESLKGESNED